MRELPYDLTGEPVEPIPLFADRSRYRLQGRAASFVYGVKPDWDQRTPGWFKQMVTEAYAKQRISPEEKLDALSEGLAADYRRDAERRHPNTRQPRLPGF